MTRLLLFSIFLISGLLFSQQQEKDATNFVNDLFSGNYENCISLLDNRVKNTFSKEIFESVTHQLSTTYGTFEKVNSAEKTSQNNISIIIVSTTFSKQIVNFQIPFSPENKITGFFIKPDEAKKYNRPQTPKPPFYYKTEDITFTNTTENNVLGGTITQPSESKNIPIVIMITGSGAQNRDEEIYGHKPYAVIADYFAKNGIASLRLDDRGIGTSESGKVNPTTADFVTDIDSAVKYLVNLGYTNIGLMGHSEGGIIAPLVAQKNKNVKFEILLAAPGILGKDVLLQQIQDINKINGKSESETRENLQISKLLYNYIQNYRGDSLEYDLTNYIDTDLLKGAKTENKELIKSSIQSSIPMISSPWFQYFIKYDPSKVLEKTKIPTLAINGSLDLQVNVKQNLSAIQNALKKAGNKNYEVHEIPNLNHLFQTTKTGNPAEYQTNEETFSPIVLKMMKDWILKLQ